jgi:hypothetical protein
MSDCLILLIVYDSTVLAMLKLLVSFKKMPSACLSHQIFLVNTLIKNAFLKKTFERLSLFKSCN